MNLRNVQNFISTWAATLLSCARSVLVRKQERLPIPKIRYAGVYLRNDVLYFHANARCTRGAHLVVAPYWSLPESSPPTEKGQLAKAAIRAYWTREVTLTDPRHPVFDPELARLSGLKTWNQFERGARSCSLTEENGQLTIMPWKNLGLRQGFGPSDAPNVVVPFDVSNEEIGQALEEAFSRAT